VHSFDYDEDSVACTQELRRRYFDGDDQWIVEQGSALDVDYLSSLGTFDIVYAWGVLHHTGDMWLALQNAQLVVADGGCLFTFVYRDQGWKSKAWRVVKRTYCSSAAGRVAMTGIFVPYYVLRGLLQDVVRLRNPRRRYAEYRRRRGMSQYYDWIDWIGGYPYEVANPPELIAFFRSRGLELEHQKRYELVFRRSASGASETTA